MSIQTTALRGGIVGVKSADDRAIAISGRVARIARVRDEPFQCIDAPEDFVARLKQQGVAADIFTFMQELADRTPKYDYYLEWDSQAVLPVTTYEHWWNKQIDRKARNMVRKAKKSGVDLRVVEFDDRLVTGIHEIYNETPVRQGRAFVHFGKDIETIEQDHKTFLERSSFIGAFCKDELVGFAKFVRGKDVASLMQIISRIRDRDKAPSNALIAKAVEMCAEEGIQYLHYGVWSTGGLGAFKMSHAFVCHQVPRYFVPLNLRGRLLLNMKLHRKWTDRLPERWLEHLRRLRNALNARRDGAGVTRLET